MRDGCEGQYTLEENWLRNNHLLPSNEVDFLKRSALGLLAIYTR